MLKEMLQPPYKKAITWLALCCFMAAQILPVMPVRAEDGTIEVQICTANGFKTLRIDDPNAAPSSDHKTDSCDDCRGCCGGHLAGPATDPVMADGSVALSSALTPDIPAISRTGPALPARAPPA